MAKQPKKFYRYRAFSTNTLNELCNDAVHFAHPGSFNDPFDCNPTLECDSSTDELRRLLEFLLRRRVAAEIRANLKRARFRGNGTVEHANDRAHREAARELANIAYLATDPEHNGTVEDNESFLLTQTIEVELLRSYERGVCCFSTTYSSLLLWSHYGDQHRGLCIGYSATRDPKPDLQKVVYGGSRGVKTSTLVNAYLNDGEQAAADLDRDVLLRKARGWEYEREWRLIGEQGPQDSPLLLKDVTFGSHCENSVMHAIVRALGGREKVEFFEMYEVRGKYALRRRPLDLDELNASMPKTAKSAVELFGVSPP